MIACSAIALSLIATSGTNSVFSDMRVQHGSMSHIDYTIGEREIACYSNTISISNTQSCLLNDDNIKAQRRYISLEGTFERYSKNVSEEIKTEFKSLALCLSNISFEDNLCKYNKVDECLDFYLSLPYDLHLNASHFIDEAENDVVFTIHHHKHLLVSDELPVGALVDKLKEILLELSANTANA